MSEQEPGYTPQDRTDEQDHEGTERPRHTDQGRTDQVEDEHPPRD